MTCIRQALAQHHGPGLAALAMDRKVLARPGYPMLGRYDRWTGVVYVRQAGPTARASALRHEFFAHVVPHTLGHGPNTAHEPKWSQLEQTLNKQFDLCWGNLANED